MPDPKPPTAEALTRSLMDKYGFTFEDGRLILDTVRAAEAQARREGAREGLRKAEAVAEEICECGGTYCLAHKVTNALSEALGEGEDNVS